MFKYLLLTLALIAQASYAQDSAVFEDLTCQISSDVNTLELKKGDESRLAVITNPLRNGSFSRDQIRVECDYDQSTVFCADYLGVIEITLDLDSIKTRCGFRRQECLEIPGELQYRKRNALGVRNSKSKSISCQLSANLNKEL